jgi:hypothetical protein
MQKPRKEFLLSILLTWITSFIGFALFYLKLVDYGFTLFIITPLCIGYFIGQKPTLGVSAAVALVFGLAVFFIMLLTAELEWLFCIVILFPLFIPVILIGIWIGYSLKKYIEKKHNTQNPQFSFYPFLILLFSGIIEHQFNSNYEYGKVESSIDLACSKEIAYDFIKSVDTLEGKKSVLMSLGLPVPQKCILEKEEIGAKRTCYFENGTIEEKVTELKKGELLKMQVTDYKLLGLRWLKFEEATYIFTQKDNFTRLTRITTYRSQLKPRFYWRFWERSAIEAEHEYVLNDLKRRLELKESKK